ncbi:MAG: hypothetical protein LBN74_06495, partial [Prevotella sp.]|nr:hypothetical protein [Prevotella sp.]
EGEYKIGKGILYIIRQDPKEYILTEKGDAKLLGIVQNLYKNVTKSDLLFKNNFHLTRGNYELISVLDESVSDNPFILKGLFIDLFDPRLPVLTEKAVQPGNQSMLFNIKSVKDKKTPKVLATAARVSDEKREKGSYSFIAKSPIETSNVTRILLPNKPKDCIVDNPDGSRLTAASWEWDKNSNTVLVKFENNPDGISVRIIY